MGLSQSAVAELSGLSRSTVSSLENGTINDLSLRRTQKLLEVLGLSLSIPEAHPRARGTATPPSPPSGLAARTANVSYSSQVTGNEIKEALLKLTVPRHAEANVRSLLEDAPVAMLARLVEQIHGESQADRSLVWSNMRKLAHKMHVNRSIFK
jgi:transcriptional regulator with XRE-family HTH domain